MADVPQLETSLNVTLGETSRTLPVARVTLTQKLHVLELGRATAPVGRLASEEVKITLRAEVNFAEMAFGSAADPVPYAKIRLDDQDVDAMVKLGQLRMGRDDPELDIVFLLLRVAPEMIQFGDDWELDDERSYSRDGVTVQTVRPKQRLRLRDNA